MLRFHEEYSLALKRGRLLRFAILVSIFVSCALTGKSQINADGSLNPIFAKKITVSGFCLCQTTLTNLRSTINDLQLTSVEEMDLSTTCYGKDAGYTNGEGYFSKQFPGMIFQQGNESDFIGKIRLTKEFKGELPNGSKVDVGKLKLRDVFGIYPNFKDSWHSRGCSDYWRFSNDTVSFYVKIDKSIQPQFPINEADYLDKPVAAIDLVLSCYGIFNKSSNIFNEPVDEPIWFLDGIRVNAQVLLEFEPREISFVTVLKDSSAIKIAGPTAKNGAIYVYTKEFARETYWEYLKWKSEDYREAVPSLKEEREVVYVLDGKVLDKDFEKDLYDINDSTFFELEVIGKQELRKKYNIKGKDRGVIIKTIYPNEDDK